MPYFNRHSTYEKSTVSLSVTHQLELYSPESSTPVLLLRSKRISATVGRCVSYAVSIAASKISFLFSTHSSKNSSTCLRPISVRVYFNKSFEVCKFRSLFAISNAALYFSIARSISICLASPSSSGRRSRWRTTSGRRRESCRYACTCRRSWTFRRRCRRAVSRSC